MFSSSRLTLVSSHLPSFIFLYYLLHPKSRHAPYQLLWVYITLSPLPSPLSPLLSPLSSLPSPISSSSILEFVKPDTFKLIRIANQSRIFEYPLSQPISPCLAVSRYRSFSLFLSCIYILSYLSNNILPITLCNVHCVLYITHFHYIIYGFTSFI